MSGAGGICPRVVRKFTDALLRRNLPCVLETVPPALAERKLELSQVIRLNCPHCRNQFEIEGVELIVFDAGAESFPITAIVDESCLVPRK